MSGRFALIAWLGLTTLAVLSGCASTSLDMTRAESNADRAARRPNIIFLLTDDQRARTFSSDGHPIIKTPHIDRLVAEGVRFTNAYVAEPTCMPSRATYLMGLYERVHGIGFTSENTLTEKQWAKSYPALLRQNGYYTGFIGKLGLERYEFRGNAAAKFDFWRGHDGWARFYPKTVENCAIYRDAEDDIITPIMGESIDRFLDACPDNKPFCLSVSFSAPHGSISGSMCPEEGGGFNRMTWPANSCGRLEDHPIYGTLYREVNVTIPDDVGTDPSPYIPSDVLAQAARRKCYSYDYDRNTSLEHHYRYYQLITGVDHVVGRLMASLKRRGLSDNTVIIYSSDHGLLMGEYGMGGKALLYDLTTRVPFVVYDPRLPRKSRGRTIDAFVLSTDVAPTILACAGVKAPASVQGRDLSPLIKNPNMDWRKDIFLENLFVGRDNPLIEAVRNHRWKYVRYFRNPGAKYTEQDVDFQDRMPIFEQLFDLRNDPEEKNNLASDEKHAEILKGFRQKCRAYSQEMVQQRKQYREQL